MDNQGTSGHIAASQEMQFLIILHFLKSIFKLVYPLEGESKSYSFIFKFYLLCLGLLWPTMVIYDSNNAIA